MIKMFCDCCGKEITDETKLNGGTLGRLGSRVNQGRANELFVEVITGKDQTSNAGHFCKYCVIDALSQADDRPQQAMPEPPASRADDFLMSCADKGRVVCSGDLTEFQIAEARASNNFYVNDRGFGFAMVPWNLTTRQDREREGSTVSDSQHG